MLRNLSLWAFVATAGVVVFATVSPIQLRPKTGYVVLERFAAYAALGGTITLAYPRQWVRSLALLSIFAIGLELLQTLEPDRHGRAADALQKLAGAVVGVSAGLIVAALAPRRASGDSSD